MEEVDEVEYMDASPQYMYPSHGIKRPPPLTLQPLSMETVSEKYHQHLSTERVAGQVFWSLTVKPPLLIIQYSKGLVLAPQKLESRLDL